MNIGLAGEYRFVVKYANGEVKKDTGYCKNLITDKGLDALGGLHGGYLFFKCAIGAGNSQPNVTQTQLDSFIAIASGSQSASKFDYNESVDAPFYKCNKTHVYRFTGLGNVNISEVGLTGTNNVLLTRALVKDVNGNPTTLTILPDETLDVYYRLWTVYDVSEKTTQISLSNGKGGEALYNVKYSIFGATHPIYANNIGSALAVTEFQISATSGVSGGGMVATKSREQGVFSTESANYYSKPSWRASPLSYTEGSYKRVLRCTFALVEGNGGGIRTMFLVTTMGCWQLNYTNVVDGSLIPKDDNHALELNVEFSWGRYEGVL